MDNAESAPRSGSGKRLRDATTWARIGLMVAGLGALVGLAPDAEAGRKKPFTPVSPVMGPYQGPDHVEVDLLRPGKEEVMRSRIYVQARLPDGEYGLFLVDTGAAVSALSEETAERLGLDVTREAGWVEGLGGRSSFDHAVLPTLQLGDAVIPDVDVAIGVKGVPTHAGWMELDGILGNNIWGRFTVEIDYPADTLVLHRPGTFEMPKKSAEMLFDGTRIVTPIRVTTETEPPHTGSLLIQLDTGASELLLAGPNALPFDSQTMETLYSEGLEPVYGIGAADTMPSNVFLRRTRRIPIDAVELGGRKVDVDFAARWLNYEPGPAIGPSDLPGLAGHELFADYVAIFDYPGGKFALKKSRRAARELDGHDVLLAQDLARYGEDAKRYLYRAELYTALEEYDKADALLEAFLAQGEAEAKDAGRARVLLAAVRRFDGDLDGAWKALEPMTPAELVAQGEIIATVNGLLLERRYEEALALADAAIEEYGPESQGDDYEAAGESSARVARADVLLAMERYAEANRELLEAARLLENPDAQLLRRARVALAAGDRYGAMANIRRLLQLYPSNGQYLWFYATLVQDEGDQETFRADMNDAIGRLHEEDRPLDYMVHAYHLMGEQEKALEMLKLGLERDCDEVDEEPTKDNCYAWYYAMAGIELENALDRITRALDAEGDRSDFLDTKAMVHLSRGELDLAHQAAIGAARLAPDEIYMLWQAERIGDIAEIEAAHNATGQR